MSFLNIFFRRGNPKIDRIEKLKNFLEKHEEKINLIREMEKEDVYKIDSEIEDIRNLPKKNNVLGSQIEDLIRQCKGDAENKILMQIVKDLEELKGVLSFQSSHILEQKGFVAARISEDLKNKGVLYSSFEQETSIHEKIKHSLTLLEFEVRFSMEPMTRKYLQKTIEMLCGVFHLEEDQELLKKHLPASLNLGYYKDEHEDISHLEYHIVRDGERVVACIGVYSNRGDEDSYWVGWFGIDKDYRGYKLGSRMLSYLFERSREDDKRFIKLYSSNHTSEAQANEMYARLGFKVFKEEAKDEVYKGYKFMYYMLNLSGKTYGLDDFFEAVRSGNKIIIRNCLSQGCDINAHDSRGWTLLHYAVFLHDKPDIAELLISKGANVNLKTRGGAEAIPLHYAVSKGFIDIVRLLLDNKADVNAEDKQGLTPLDWAESHRVAGKPEGEWLEEIIELIRKHGGKTSGKKGLFSPLR